MRGEGGRREMGRQRKEGRKVGRERKKGRRERGRVEQ